MHLNATIPVPSVPGRRIVDGLVGLTVAAAVLGAQMAILGPDPAAALHVGEQFPARPHIERELGPVPLAPGPGHDGQQFYLIARDPFATGGAVSSLDEPGFRYRRILYPLLAGGFGLLPPAATVVSLLVWGSLGMAVGAVALGSLLDFRGGRRWGMIGILGNPGAWLSLRSATADVLALGLALGAVALWARNRRLLATLLCATAALTKETYLLVPLALAALEWVDGDRRSAFLTAGGAALPLLAWSAWVTLAVGSAFVGRGNLGLPLVGLLQSASLRGDHPEEALFVLLGIASLVITAVGLRLARWSLLTWLTVPWLVLGVISSHLVWDFGNNALRVLAPVWAFGCLAWATYLESTSRRNLPV